LIGKVRVRRGGMTLDLTSRVVSGVTAHGRASH
jgi:hypothetical protein